MRRILPGWRPLLRRNETPAGRDYPMAAPAHNRVDLAHPRHRVAPRRPPDPTGSFQDGRPAAHTARSRKSGGANCRSRDWLRHFATVPAAGLTGTRGLVLAERSGAQTECHGRFDRALIHRCSGGGY